MNRRILGVYRCQKKVKKRVIFAVHGVLCSALLCSARASRASRANRQQHSGNIFWLNKQKQPKRRYLSWRQIPKNTKNRTSVVKT